MALTDKRVVIVGGTSGIGLATAKAFLARSASVVIASRSPSNLSLAGKALDGEVTAMALDFRQDTMVKSFFEAVGAFDHLVVTAGEVVMGDFPTILLSAAQDAFESKFWGQYRIVRGALPVLNSGASITLTSGVYGIRPPRGAAVVSAINSAIEGLVRGLAIDLAPLRVNAVCPGIVDTPIYSTIPAAERRAMFEDLGRKLPVGRIARAEDVAQSYVYLAENGFATGSVVLVDGGGHLV